MNDSAPLLQACNVGRRPRGADRWLLRGIRLDLVPGERLAIAGPSGAGKTLLLRALAAMDPLDEGEVLFQGRRCAARETPRFRREVVYLQQRPALFEGTVEENLRRPFTLNVHRRRSYRRRRIVQWLESLGRDAAFLRKVDRDLSGGEAQIVALLRALQLDPTVLLLDEPAASLDPKASGAVEHLVGGWLNDRPESRAIVWVSHDAEQTGRIADRTVRLRDGRIEQER